MFVDSVSIFIGSGHGGAGAVSFRREICHSRWS